MAKVTFDGVNKLIIVDPGFTELDVKVDLYSDWKEWSLLSDNLKYLPAFRAVGGDAVSATKNLGSTFFLINDWRIRPDEVDHRLIITGNIFTDPAGFSPVVPTLGDFNVVVEYSTSNLIDGLDAPVSSRAEPGDAMSLVPDAVNASAVAVGALTRDAFASDVDTYQAKVWFFDDNANLTDRYTVVWYKNGEPVTTSITSPLIQVYKVADGTDLVAETSMVEIGSTGTYRYNESSNRMVDGVAYIAQAKATIASSQRRWFQPVGRDSS